MTHILIINGSNKCLKSVRRQALPWDHAYLLLIEPSASNFNDTRIKIFFIQENEFESIVYKMASILFRHACRGVRYRQSSALIKTDGSPTSAGQVGHWNLKNITLRTSDGHQSGIDPAASSGGHGPQNTNKLPTTSSHWNRLRIWYRSTYHSSKSPDHINISFLVFLYISGRSGPNLYGVNFFVCLFSALLKYFPVDN